MFSRLTVPQKRLWGVGAAIVGFGLFKVRHLMEFVNLM
jgi:hypothetical protein